MKFKNRIKVWKKERKARQEELEDIKSEAMDVAKAHKKEVFKKEYQKRMISKAEKNAMRQAEWESKSRGERIAATLGSIKVNPQQTTQTPFRPQPARSLFGTPQPMKRKKKRARNVFDFPSVVN